MAFSSKNLHSGNMSLVKWATLFFLGVSCILFVTRAFNISPIATNSVQYISKIFLTTSWENTSATWIILDGTPGGGITIASLTSAVVLATDNYGKLLAAKSWSVYNFISGYVINWANSITWATPFWNWSSWITNNANIFNTGWNVGIGTDIPWYTLDVSGSANILRDVLIGGVLGVGVTPLDRYTLTVSGSIYSNWFISKWNGVSVSWNYSTAMGNTTQAIWDYSTAMGWGTKSVGSYSTAMWWWTQANGFNSTAMGNGTQAEWIWSTAMWWLTYADGNYSTAMGYHTTANSKSTATAMGSWTTAGGETSTAMGNGTQAIWDYSTAMGDNTIAAAINSFAVGIYNTWLSNSVFEIGIGTSSWARANAMTVLANGNVGIGTWATAPSAALTVAGGIRPVVVNLQNVCADTAHYPAGTLYYSSGHNSYCYCNNSNAWVLMGSGASCL